MVGVTEERGTIVKGPSGRKVENHCVGGRKEQLLVNLWEAADITSQTGVGTIAFKILS